MQPDRPRLQHDAARTDAGFDLRGKTAAPEVPFLYSTAGYGEHFPARGRYRFDFTAPDRYRVEAPAIDYYFYYGPGIKQVFEEHRAARGTPAMWAACESLATSICASRWCRRNCICSAGMKA